jgi:non-specific serine/threonine protein kinase
VALKLLPESTCDAQSLERFRREAQSASALNHPHICTVHDIGEHDGRRFMVMELLSGSTLHDLLRSGPLPPERLFEYAAQIAGALAAAHARSIVHRDIKPGNIVVTSHGIKVLDFGLAKRGPESEPAPGSSKAGGSGAASSSSEDAETEYMSADPSLLTSPGLVLGTIAYMSPEQALGRAVDARSDLFSFGAVLHEMATGRRAFPGATPAAVFDAILHRPPDGDLPASCAGLKPVLEKLLQKDAAKRTATAAETAAELRSLQPGAPGRTGGSAAASSAVRHAAKETPSIAVLPFRNLSPDPENEFFTDGMTEEILGALSKIRALRVASRTSSFAFKGRNEDVREIGRALGVGAILEGSVRRSGSRMRVSVQLAKAEDGYQLWSDRFDRELADVFAVQDEIAEKVAAALRLVLTDSEKQNIRRIPTENLEAYECYLKAREVLRLLHEKSFSAARRLFERAAALDPDFAPAWIGVVESCYWIYIWRGKDPEQLEAARKAAAKALEIAPDLAEAHVAQGLTWFMLADNAAAHRSFQRAIELDPKSFDAHYFAARAWVSQGKLEEAAASFERASEVCPDDYQAPTLLATCYKGLGRLDDERRASARALEVIEKHLEYQPGDVRATYMAANNTLVATGDREKAIAWARKAQSMDPDSLSFGYNIACFYATLGMNTEALDLLERNVDTGWGQRAWIEHDPDWFGVKDDPRFHASLAKMK